MNQQLQAGLSKWGILPREVGKQVRQQKVAEAMDLIENAKAMLEQLRDAIKEKQENISETQPGSYLEDALEAEYDALTGLIDDLEAVVDNNEYE